MASGSVDVKTEGDLFVPRDLLQEHTTRDHDLLL